MPNSIDNQKTLSSMKPIPFKGGCNTFLSVESIPPGGYSMIQNYRNQHPGFKPRNGYIPLHTVADGTNKGMSLYQFSKGRRSEKHFFAQMSDGDVLEATNAPPAVTTGAFGSEVFSGSSSSIPASFSNMNDLMLFSDGVDQHQIYAGLDNYVYHFSTYSSASTLPAIPQYGSDYTSQLSVPTAVTPVSLAALGTNATDAILVCTTVVSDRIHFIVGTANTTTATMTVKYYNGSWTALSKTDNTSSGGKTLAVSGYVTWTLPTDAVPSYMYGKSGYWLQINFSAALSAGTAITAFTYGANSFQPVKNVWDGAMVNAIEARVYDASSGVYYTYGSTSIDLALFTTSDYLYFNSYDPIMAFYVDPTSVPSTTGSVSISEVATWDGSAFQAVSNLVDGTAGFTKPGWTTFSKYANIQRLQFQGANYYSFWYRVKTTGGTLSDPTAISLYTMPYFNIDDYFTAGQCSIAWKHRAIYASPNDQFIYVSAQNQPMMLNGSDSSVLEPGDGRSNKPVCMRLFKNELMVWQEERGTDGGCFTLFEGYTPETFGKLLLDSKLGAMNWRSAAVVDNILVSTGTGYKVTTVVFVLSHYGVYMSDGISCTFISDDIRNYFDPRKSECIRRGYENEMYLFYDAADNVLRIGLVSGTSSSVCNIFPVYDLIEQAWTFDVFANSISAMAEVEASSGDVTVLQVGAGSVTGFIYQLNKGDTDNSTAISSYATMEIDGGGMIINVREVSLIKSGTCQITPYSQGTAQTAHTIAS